MQSEDILYTQIIICLWYTPTSSILPSSFRSMTLLSPPNHKAFLFSRHAFWIPMTTIRSREGQTCVPGYEIYVSHYDDVIISAMAPQDTSLTIVYSTVYSGADQRKYQSSTSLAFVRGIHRWLVNSPHKGLVTRNDVIVTPDHRPGPYSVYGKARPQSTKQDVTCLNHISRVTHICVSKLTISGSDNGLSPSRHQVIIWTYAAILLIRSLGINFSKISIKIPIFSFMKMPLKWSSAKWRSFCLGLNVLMQYLIGIDIVQS